jgi:hypothetical protein
VVGLDAAAFFLEVRKLERRCVWIWPGRRKGQNVKQVACASGSFLEVERRFGVVLVLVAPLVSTNKYFRPRSKLRPLS